MNVLLSSAKNIVFVLKPSRLRFLFVLLVSLIGFSAATFAQQATIVGTVTDPSGAVVPNVTVTVTDTDTGVAHVIPTNNDGQYVSVDLPVGHYQVKAEAKGFKVAERKGIILTVGDRIRVDFQMQLGASQETVTVEANANTVHVQTDTSDQSTLVNDKQITELATNGRTIYSYIALTPGAAALNPDSQLPVPVGGASGNISFNGNRPGHNLYLLDGGENDDRGGAGSSSVLPSIDAIAETETLTSNYSPEYGISSGGTISSVIKSGTDKYHASAWEFFRNDDLDARNFFNPAPQAVAELRYNIFGFNAGGPVPIGHVHKTFFFYNMEWRRFVSGGSPINQTVPLPSTYGGDFTGAVPADGKDAMGNVVAHSGLHVPCANQLSASQIAAYNTAGITTFSTPNGDGGCSIPSSASVTDPVFQPFPGNAIPSSLLNPNANTLLTGVTNKYGTGIFPTPTSGTQFQEPVSLPTDVREEIVRIDENLTSKFNLYGHFLAEQIAQNMATTMWSGDNVPTVANTFGNPSYAAVVHTAYIINPDLVNEVSFNYNGNRIHILPTGAYAAPSSFVFNRFFTGPNQGDRIPSIDLGGSTGANYTANWTPWNNKADSYQIRDDVSWTRGRHQFKMGGGWLLYKKSQDWFKNTQGSFTFNGFYTGNDFADFLLGDADSYSEDAIKSTGQWNNVSWDLYFLDNYRVNNRLTLNIGMRWDGLPHTYEANMDMANFFPNLYNSADAAVLASGNQTIDPSSPGLGTSPNPILANQLLYTNGVSICGQNGTPRGCVNGAWLNFEPRVGFAYDISGDGKTVIRGGYGIMDERIQGNDVYNNAGTVPLAASISFPNVSLSNPTVSVGPNPISVSIPINNITGMNLNDYGSPRSSQFSLGVQHSIGTSVLSLAYVGTQNRHQNYYTETDLIDPAALPAQVSNSATYNTLVPYLGYHSIKMSENEANGDYNAFQASFRGTFKTDLTYQFGYTYSHTNDVYTSGNSAGDLGAISNPYQGWSYDYGPAPYDIHNIFAVNFVYNVPFMRHSDNHLMRSIVGGWEVSGIVTAESGAPLNIGLSGNNVASVVPNTANRPDLVGPITKGPTSCTGPSLPCVQWINSSAFGVPAVGTWGNTPPDSVVGPGRDNWNISFFKNFMLNESRGSNLQFRAEFFNIWNHTQFIGNTVQGGISTSYGSSNFGQITSATDPRIIQLALKLYF
jgi:Carboxypeptidase regulatory-like domain